MLKDIKEEIINKFETFVKTNENKGQKNERFILSSFNDIQIKKTERISAFYHPLFKNKTHYFLNEEELTDFLIFEKNAIYIDFNDQLFNFSKCDEDERLLYLDFENLTFSETKPYIEENLSEEVQQSEDKIYVNYFPINNTHTNLVLFADQNYPQLLSNELIMQALLLFNLSEDPNLILGYDSLGAGCLINQLHFQILYSNVNDLLIHQVPDSFVFETRLIHKDPEEISIFDQNVSIKFSIIDNYVRAWKIRVSKEITNEEINNLNELDLVSGSHDESTAHCVYSILDILIENEIPHNVLFVEKGCIVYIIPRYFEKGELRINSSFNDMAGLITVKDEESFKTFTEEDYLEELGKLRMVSDEFMALTEKIVEKFESKYLINKE